MKIFANKNIWKKIVLIFTIITTLSNAAPKPVEAGIGGELMEPICDLVVGLGDGVIRVTHDLMIKQSLTMVRIDENGWLGKLIRIKLTIAAAAVAAVCIITGVGAIAAAVTGVTLAEAITVSIVVAGAIGGTYAGVKVYSADMFDNEIALPLYSMSPEEIFKNKIPLFNVNFFNPDSLPIEYEWAVGKQDNILSPSYITTKDYNGSDVEQFNKDIVEETGMTFDAFKNGISPEPLQDGDDINVEVYERKIAGETWKVTITYEDIVTSPNYKSMQIKKISKNPSSTDDGLEGSGKGKIYGFSYELQKIVAKWYFILRMIAIVGMMSVLVYSGIRILISSTASQKAKYNQLLGDWLVGMVLLFTMHYIMNFANIFTEQLTNVFSSVNPKQHVAIIEDKNGSIEKALEDEGISITDSPEVASADNKVVYKFTRNGKKYIEWHTNLMGAIRIELQKYSSGNSGDDAYIGYTIMFVVMVIYTIMFCWTYIKRVIYMAFLTLISPLVALTYPIDKANDGSAQGFNFWFKEYIFNLLLQPMHLLIYTILISSAYELALKNWIYALVSIGFIATAEKLVRQMFNFSKAHTPGVFAGPAGAALTMTGMRFLFGHGPKGGNEGKKDGGSGSANGGNSNKGITRSGKGTSVRDGLSGLLPSDGNNSSSKNITEAMNEAELDSILENGGAPSAEYYDMMNNDIMNGGLGEGGQQYSDEEYRQILLDSGLTEEDIEKGDYIDKEDSLPVLDDEKDDKASQKGSLGRAILSSAGVYKDGLMKNFKRSIKEGKPIKTMNRLAAGAAAGATFGMIGLASGIAAGDAKTAFQNAGFTAAGGYKLGSNTVDSTTRALQVDGVKENFERSYYGEKEYKNRKAREAQLEIAHDENTIRLFQDKLNLSREKAKKKAEELSHTYMEEGINNPADWIYLEKMQKEKIRDDNGRILKIKDENGKERDTYSRDEAIAAYKIRNRSGVASNDREKSIKKIMADNPNISKSEANIYYRTAKTLDNLMND